MGVTGKARQDFWNSLYALWAFLHLLFKIFITTYTSAKVNYHVHHFADILYNIPDQLESSKVRKIRTYLGTKAFGINGLNCFVIRTPFMLSLLSFVFTFEIVLFQSTFPSCGNITGNNNSNVELST